MRAGRTAARHLGVPVAEVDAQHAAPTASTPARQHAVRAGQRRPSRRSPARSYTTRGVPIWTSRPATTRRLDRRARGPRRHRASRTPRRRRCRLPVAHRILEGRAQVRVEVRGRLVQQEHPRRRGQARAPARRAAAARPTAARAAAGRGGRCRARRAACAPSRGRLGAASSRPLQRIRDSVEDGQVRPQREVLEHQADIALFGRACCAARSRRAARDSQISPADGCTSPATACSSVDLPEPDAPSSATTSPGATVRSTSSIAGTPRSDAAARQRSGRSSARCTGVGRRQSHRHRHRHVLGATSRCCACASQPAASAGTAITTSTRGERHRQRRGRAGVAQLLAVQHGNRERLGAGRVQQARHRHLVQGGDEHEHPAAAAAPARGRAARSCAPRRPDRHR